MVCCFRGCVLCGAATRSMAMLVPGANGLSSALFASCWEQPPVQTCACHGRAQAKDRHMFDRDSVWAVR